MNKGPKAKPRMKMDTTKVASVSFELPSSFIIWGTPGAIIDDASGVKKERNDIVAIIPHFRPFDQLMGFSGSRSAGSSHQTE